MVNFKELKQSADSDKLSQALEKINNPQQDKITDDRFWKPTTDDAGNGYAVIRFLPAPAVDGDDALPWVRYWDHFFKGTSGLVYSENSLTTIGKTDPVGEENSRLWNTGLESDKDIARDRKRRLNYVVNIYVVEDKAAPENEGKVFLYRFGKKIMDKINEAMNPQFADEAPMNPFNLWKGANFKLKIRMVKEFRNYDSSSFATSAPLLSDDDAMEKIWKSEYSLNEFSSPANFKSYDELKARFLAVIGDGNSSAAAVDDDIPFDVTPAKKSVDVDDEGLDFFKKLAEED